MLAPSARWPTWRRRATLIGGIGVAVGIAFWFCLQYIPTWYQPATLSPADLRDARASLPKAFQEFSDRLVQGRPFEFNLAATTVNQWLAGRHAIWPDKQDPLPPWLRDPVVAFEGDKMFVGGRFERNGWRAILSTQWSLNVQSDGLLLTAEKAGVGAVRFPVTWVLESVSTMAGMIQGDLANLPDALQSVSQAMEDNWQGNLAGGVHVENRIIWPNGDRPFRIQNLRAAGGTLHLKIEPL